MSTADKIEQVILKAAGIGVAFWAILAAREAAKRKATADYYAEKETGANGIGKTTVIKGNGAMTERELLEFTHDTRHRLMSAFGMSGEQANFVISLERHTHSTLGAALYEINDFLDSRGL